MTKSHSPILANPASRFTQETYIQALHFAAEAHGEQKVPGSNFPYLAHLTLVTMEVIAALGVEPEADGNLAVQCALLHDTIEDTAATYQQIQEQFGQAVADGVQALTKDHRLDKPSAMPDSLARITQQPREIGMVKLADRITNLLPPPHYWTREKIAAYREEARLIHAALHSASPYLAARLAEKIEGYGKYLI